MEDLCCHPSPVGLPQKGCHPVRHWLLCILLLLRMLVAEGALIAEQGSLEYIEISNKFYHKAVQIQFAIGLTQSLDHFADIVKRLGKHKRAQMCFNRPVTLSQRNAITAKVMYWKADGEKKFRVFINRKVLEDFPSRDLAKYLKKLKKKMPPEYKTLFSQYVDNHQISFPRTDRSYESFYEELLGLRRYEAKMKKEGVPAKKWIVSIAKEKEMEKSEFSPTDVEGGHRFLQEAWQNMNQNFVVELKGYFNPGPTVSLTDVVLNIGANETEMKPRLITCPSAQVLFSQADCERVEKAVKDGEKVNLTAKWKTVSSPRKRNYEGDQSHLEPTETTFVFKILTEGRDTKPEIRLDSVKVGNHVDVYKNFY
eukprot:GHVS01034561.1.p1 GENE.GHVS01034561.1~~GHVS01034561.1.p1  ORF type:complete len:397 (+),score=25.68 GHVS01034561.1:92-1192(+)